MSKKDPAEKVVRDIRRKTRRRHSTEEKIRIVLEGLRGEESIAALCRREGIAESLYYSWSKEFLEAGKLMFVSNDVDFNAFIPLSSTEAYLYTAFEGAGRRAFPASAASNSCAARGSGWRTCSSRK